jgi:periplasmic copper chaperone A
MLRRTVLFLPLAVPAQAHSYKIGQIAIGHAWALPSQQTDGQVFIPLLNSGDATDQLIAARSPVCTLVELRTNARYDDPAASDFELVPQKPLPMRPSARHLRLIGLSKPLLLGDRFALVLDFVQAGETEVTVYVEDSPGI